MEKKLLLVDDEADIREILSLYIADMGFDVTAAADGLEALDRFEAERPPLVVTDIKMPGLDGIELLREVKRREPDTEVIMITGHGDLDLAIRSLKYEAADFITKPINQDILDAAIHRAFEKTNMREQIRAHDEHLHQLVQEELRTTRHKYHQLFEAAPSFISVQDRNLHITESNRLFKENFDEQYGAFCYRAYKHRNDPCPECPVIQTFEDGRSHRMETVVTTKTGQQYNVLITTAPIRDADGSITHVMEVSTDITQIRELQDQLTSLGLLIGSVSHGIKGLLTGLDGGMYLVNAGLAKDDQEKIEEGWDIVKMMVGRIRKQVLDILYYAKNRELEYERVPVDQFAEELAVTVEKKAQDRNVRFIRQFETGLGEFDADTGVLASALVNILENAVDASAEMPAETPGEVRFQVSGDAGAVFFDVIDNGPGIDRETREKMFTLFFSSKGNKGTGLGLFIANKMVRQHGGGITVSSAPEKGARFRIRVPRYHDETGSVQQ